MVFQEQEFHNVSCCGYRNEVIADKVDVYYWPDPDADTSCLGIVGNGSFTASGATTDNMGHAYWGCTVWGTSLGILNDQSSTIVTTATLSSIAGISYKAYLYNPWDPSQCGNASEPLSLQQSSTKSMHNSSMSLYRRGHSLILTSSGMSTTVFGDYTL